MIDSKGKNSKDVTDNNPRGPSLSWNHGDDRHAFRSPVIERQPEATIPKVISTMSDDQSDPIRNVPLRPSYPQSRPQAVSRNSPQSTQPLPPRPLPIQPQSSQPRVLPINKPLVNTRSRTQSNNPLSSRPQPTSRPSSTTTTTTTTREPPKLLSSDYDNEYVDFETVPTGSANGQGPNGQGTGLESVPEAVNSRSKRSPKRRKGKLLNLPSDFLTRPTNTTIESSSNSTFTCSDKVSTLAYTDIASNCTKFHLCLEIKKGKMRDNVLYCQVGHGYSQEAAACLPLGSFDCINSSKYFVLDKSKSGGKTWKSPIEWTKKSLHYKYL